MATKQLQSAPTPTRPRSTNGVINERKAGTGDSRIVVIVYGQGQEKIVSVFADVLGKPYRLASSFSAVGSEDHGTVIGVAASDAKVDIGLRNRVLIVAINAHCVNYHFSRCSDGVVEFGYSFCGLRCRRDTR
jgi:3-dehydroquinate dehydratase-1